MTFSPPDHEIVRVPFGSEGEVLRQGCYSIRINVFHHEQGYPLEVEIDELRLIWPHRPHRPLLWSRVNCLFPRLHTD